MRSASVSGDAAAGPQINRGAVTASIMLATFMQGVDTTIANVALPHMQGSFSCSQDQIAWAVTSYIVAAAIMTPLTGWLAGRFGIKYVFLFSVIGFTPRRCAAPQPACFRSSLTACCKGSAARRWFHCHRRHYSTSTRPNAMPRRWRSGAWG
jgi:Major Facilitator Superfamily